MSQQVFTSFPLTRPPTPLLDDVNASSDLNDLDAKQLVQLADELREYLLFTVGRTGGHFGAGLGVVELTIALHKVFNTPDDRIVWDVGHQTYPHKILTGRREAMANLRLQEGIAGFPKRSESEYDTFGVGHSSTSISAALGMALASQQKGEQRHSVAVIGDGAMTAGMAFEALHHAAHTKANMLVVLNDNQMSISANEGGLASYFAKIWASKAYTSVRERGKNLLSHLPEGAMELAKRTEEHMKGMVSPATLFEELGFNYIGPVDGHDLPGLLSTLGNVSALKGPQLIHVFTQKGHGFTPAVEEPTKYHAIAKIAPQTALDNTVAKHVVKPALPKYQDVFGQWLCDMAAADDNLVGITPAMCEGSGMVAFSQQFASRYHDVAIAEQHAVTLAAGFACEGTKPVVAIYSTFLQRAYDQLIHDVTIQDLDVLFAIDRAGLVGEDGPTHAGSFDLSFLRCIPNMLIAAPSDENECRLLLNSAYHYKGPSAVRYPRGSGTGVDISSSLEGVEIGRSRLLRQGAKVAILSFGVLLSEALVVADEMNASVLDMRFIKPLDANAIDALLEDHSLLVTLEDNVLMGGAGSAVNEYLHQQGVLVSVLNLALPDIYVGHGKRADLLADCGLDAVAIEAAIRKRLGQLQ